MNKFVYIILFSSVVCLLSACGSDKEEMSRFGGDDDAVWVNLDINVSLTDVMHSGITRAEGDGYEDAANGYELMSTLRIIVVRPDNTVEENRFISFRDVLQHYGDERFKVRGRETKRVYLFANENSSIDIQSEDGVRIRLKDELERIKKGDAFPAEKIGKLMVKLDEGKQLEVKPNYVPMNECHTVEVGETDRKADLFIIRTAVKYSFYVKNESSLDKTVTGYAVHNMARQAYLLPRGVRYRDVEGSDGTIYKEIEAFEVPETEYYTYRFNASYSLPKNKEITLAPSCYFLEGKHVYEGEGGADEKKNYSISLWVDGVELKGFLENVPQLPRNTHVKVYITIKDTSTDWKVDVRPYTEVTLDPDFGL
ncbi:hypothetical protein [Bacteroides xylanisolvens]|uniref:hypothetical protein n=1 Tax=Bacteroides xylanisolvens TaxID=371601 RepID=UPI00374F1FD9